MKPPPRSTICFNNLIEYRGTFWGGVKHIPVIFPGGTCTCGVWPPVQMPTEPVPEIRPVHLRVVERIQGTGANPRPAHDGRGWCEMEMGGAILIPMALSLKVFSIPAYF